MWMAVLLDGALSIMCMQYIGGPGGFRVHLGAYHVIHCGGGGGLSTLKCYHGVVWWVS